MSLPGKPFLLADSQTLFISLLDASQAASCAELIPKNALDRWSENNIASTIDGSANTLCLGASLGNNLVGFALFSQVLDEMELLYIAVDERNSGKGIATMVLTEALSLTEKTVNNVFLEVRRSNVNAIKLYKKLGFEQVGERKNYYAVPSNTAFSSQAREDALLFALER